MAIYNCGMAKIINSCKSNVMKVCKRCCMYCDKSCDNECNKSLWVDMSGEWCSHVYEEKKPNK